MTALNIATDIPSNINSLEKLAVWASNCLFTLNPSVVAVEGENFSQRSAQAGTYFVAATNKTRHVGRNSIVLTANYAVGDEKQWFYAEELSAAPLTASMKTN
ncbi:hypothetical protein [Chamaesiphon sp. VAR_48_metabat_403]|uniref:hypothetical protein n=1 Tax=Chamaesiphon sp. VAR_48_metabat_403 TaxID=2964700 RepID=UPI00286DCC42|nr:hypothetical protein [Chamaesiphon sp. VAR_48_metabat_403]